MCVPIVGNRKLRWSPRSFLVCLAAKYKKRKTCPLLRLSCRACILRLCHIRLRALSVLRRRNCELYRVCFPYRRSITAIVVKPCVLRALSQRLRSPFSDKSFRELTTNEQQVIPECDYRSSSCIRLRHRACRNYSTGKQQTAYSSSVCWSSHRQCCCVLTRV